MEYAEIKEEVIKAGLTNRYTALCYLLTIGVPFGAYLMRDIEWLVKEGIIEK